MFSPAQHHHVQHSMLPLTGTHTQIHNIWIFSEYGIIIANHKFQQILDLLQDFMCRKILHNAKFMLLVEPLFTRMCNTNGIWQMNFSTAPVNEQIHSLMPIHLKNHTLDNWTFCSNIDTIKFTFLVTTLEIDFWGVNTSRRVFFLFPSSWNMLWTHAFRPLVK